jgi:hypothetical protein
VVAKEPPEALKWPGGIFLLQLLDERPMQTEAAAIAGSDAGRWDIAVV